MRKRIMAHVQGNVVGYLALFVALGGTTAWAADKITSKDIAKNAVLSRHIKNGQVKSADVQDNGLTGTDVNEATLGQVPSAASANKATTADSATTAQTAGSASSADSAATAQIAQLAQTVAADAIGTAQVANGSLTGADVQDDSLTGSDVNESSLGTVPQASNADTLDSKDSTAFGAGIEGGKIVGVSSGTTFPPIGLGSGPGSFLAPTAFVARDLRITLQSLNGATETRTFALIVGGAPSPLTCSVGANQGSCVDTTHTASLSPGNTYGLQETATTGSPAPIDVQFGWRAVTP